MHIAQRTVVTGASVWLNTACRLRSFFWGAFSIGALYRCCVWNVNAIIRAREVDTVSCHFATSVQVLVIAKLLCAEYRVGTSPREISHVHRAAAKSGPFSARLRSRAALFCVLCNAHRSLALKMVGVIFESVSIGTFMRFAFTFWSTAMSRISTITCLCLAHDLMRIVSECEALATIEVAAHALLATTSLFVRCFAFYACAEQPFVV
mmetsp:Transcript_9604/g.15529  ORF Transcript_9604/g.15529 Transcript_9604/m.15529 type:complete len:207 (+) Transcript_9604:2863-3483(+)